MLRGYSSLLAALAGLAALVTAFGAGLFAPTLSHTQDHLPSSSLNRQPVITGQRQACINDEEEPDDCSRASQQAAINQAVYAYWQTVFSAAAMVVGGATLIAAWRAAGWAKEAALYTRDGAVEAKRSAAAANLANRPWLGFDDPDVCYVQVTQNVPNGAVRTPIQVTNYGTSPAIRPRLAQAIVSPDESIEDTRQMLIDQLKSDRTLSKSPVYPRKSVILAENHTQGISINAVDRDDFIRGYQRYTFLIYVGYRSISGEFYHTGDIFYGVDILAKKEIVIGLHKSFGGDFGSIA